MTSKQLNYLIQFFDLLCFKTQFSIKPNSGFRKYIHSIVQIALAVYFSYLSWTTFDSLLSFLDTLEATNLCIEYIITVVTYWLIIVDSYAHAKGNQIFWSLFRRIDTMNRNHNLFRFNSFSLKLFEFILFVVLSLGHYGYVSFFFKWNVFLTIMSFFVLIHTCQVKMFQYLLYLDLIIKELRTIELELKEMVRINRLVNRHYSLPLRSKSKFKTLELNRFRWIKEYFQIVSKMVERMNEIYGWSHLSGIIFCFAFLLTRSNALVDWFEMDFETICVLN